METHQINRGISAADATFFVGLWRVLMGRERVNEVFRESYF